MPHRLVHKSLLSQPGVYQIRCVPTCKIYIGGSTNLRHRWHVHRRRLRQGSHQNPYLQAAWDKYGEAAFEFEAIEYVERGDLLTAEQKWIDRTQCTNRKIGFNVYPIAGSPGEVHAKVWKGFINPDSREVVITNLFEFCRVHDLDFPSMHRLAMGNSKLKSYKGWTHRNSPRQRDFIKTYTGFVAPDGRPAAPITNLAEFCRQQGLDKTHMVAVAHRRICSHRGWTHINGRPKKETAKTYTGFVNSAGQHVTITNLQAFCRQHGLQVSHMRQLISGQRKSHKAWTWRNTE
ncbi:MAG: GIY-YIG nuclease family protein [Anaerolineales bacterium]